MGGGTILSPPESCRSASAVERRTQESPNQHHSPCHHIWRPQDNIIKCSLTQAMVAERCPEEAWIHAYTDGSATDAVTSGGAGVYVKPPDGEVQSASIPTGKDCSNYVAEIQALVEAACMIRDLATNVNRLSACPTHFQSW